MGDTRRLMCGAKIRSVQNAVNEDKIFFYLQELVLSSGAPRLIVH